MHGYRYMSSGTMDTENHKLHVNKQILSIQKQLQDTHNVMETLTKPIEYLCKENL